MFTKGQRQCLKKSWTLTPALDKSLTMSLSLTREIKLCPLFNQKRKAAFQPALLRLRSVFGYETEAYRVPCCLSPACLWITGVYEWVPSVILHSASTYASHYHDEYMDDLSLKKLCVCRCVGENSHEFTQGQVSLYQRRGAEIGKETLSLIWFEDRAMMGRLHILYDLV